MGDVHFLKPAGAMAPVDMFYELHAPSFNAIVSVLQDRGCGKLSSQSLETRDVQDAVLSSDLLDFIREQSSEIGLVPATLLSAAGKAFVRGDVEAIRAIAPLLVRAVRCRQRLPANHFPEIGNAALMELILEHKLLQLFTYEMGCVWATQVRFLAHQLAHRPRKKNPKGYWRNQMRARAQTCLVLLRNGADPQGTYMGSHSFAHKAERLSKYPEWHDVVEFLKSRMLSENVRRAA